MDGGFLPAYYDGLIGTRPRINKNEVYESFMRNFSVQYNDKVQDITVSNFM